MGLVWLITDHCINLGFWKLALRRSAGRVPFDKIGGGIRVTAEKDLNNQLAGGIMKFFVIVLLFWFALTMPGSAESAERIEYRIVQIKEGTTVLVGPDQKWQVCSNYFFAVETPTGKKVYFHIERKVDEKLQTRPVFAPIDQIEYKVGAKTAKPSLTFSKSGSAILYVLQMGPADYIAGLPCLADAKGKLV